MNNALIGFSGFVGQTLLKQAHFQHQFRSTNIHEIKGCSFETLVCAGAPAQKWIANKDPEADLAKVKSLMDHLSTVRCKKIILISTVDVFQQATDVDEDTEVIESGLHPYGLHRRYLEKFVQDHFDRSLIIRLPGLVGPGLKKNVIFDFLNNNNVAAIDSRAVFQFYPMVNLWHDIQFCLSQELSLAHLTAEPISVSEISTQGFGRPFEQAVVASPARYDMKSLYGQRMGGIAGYQYSKREAIQAIRAYAQSEPMSANQTN